MEKVDEWLADLDFYATLTCKVPTCMFSGNSNSGNDRRPAHQSGVEQ